MAAYDDLRDEITIIKWLERINRRPKTEKAYLLGFQKYVEFTKMSPTELLQEAKREIRENVDGDDRAILNRRYAFRNYLQKTTLSPNSIQSAMNAVTSFYSTFSLNPPKLKGNKRPSPKEENAGIIEKADIHDVLTITDPLEKAVVLTGASSGLGMSDIINLTLRQYKEGRDKENNICVLNLTRIKTGVKFTCFISSECCTAIDSYIEYRSRPSAPRQHVVNDDGYLFIQHRISKQYNPEDPKTEEYRKFTEVAFTRMYARLAERAQKINPNGWNLVRSHQLRKFFNNTLRHAGLDYAFCEHMLGHKADDVDSAYLKVNPEELKRRYLLYMPYLTIEKGAAFTEETFEDMKAEITKLKAESETNKLEAFEHQRLESDFKNYRIETHIRMMEMERDSAIKPYEFEIEKNNEEIERLGSLKGIIAMDNGYIIETGDLEKEQQKTLREENKKLKMQIQRIKAFFQKDIDEFKRNPY